MHDENHPQPADTNSPDAPVEASEAASSGGDVLSLIEDVERHLERIRNVQTRQTTDFADLAERQRRVGVAEAEMVERGQALESSARDLGIARETIESDRRTLEEDRIRLEDQEATVAEQSANVDRIQAEIESVRTELEVERERLGDLEQGLVTRTTEFEHRVADLAAREGACGGAVICGIIPHSTHGALEDARRAYGR